MINAIETEKSQDLNTKRNYVWFSVRSNNKWRIIKNPLLSRCKWLDYSNKEELEQSTIPVDLRYEVLNVSYQLKGLVELFESSKEIYRLKDNWDDEGSKGYSKNTWLKMATFLIKSAIYLFENKGIIADLPKISPGPDGSIDLYWKEIGYSLLLNIPEKNGEPVSYYGENNHSNFTKGTFDLSQITYINILCAFQTGSKK